MPDLYKQVCKQLKALYSLKQAPCLQQKKLAKALAKLDFKLCTSDQYVYINKDTRILIVTYVNNMLILKKGKREIKILKQDLAVKFEIEDLGPTKYFVEVYIT